MSTAGSTVGTVEAVRGSVVDACFTDHIPSINHILTTGDQGSVIIEVAAHLDARTIRGIALTPTRGLSRGSPVLNTGQPLKAPVGPSVLGRMFDVFGNAIDRKPEVEGVEWRSIHAASVPL